MLLFHEVQGFGKHKFDLYNKHKTKLVLLLSKRYLGSKILRNQKMSKDHTSGHVFDPEKVTIIRIYTTRNDILNMKSSKVQNNGLVLH